MQKENNNYGNGRQDVNTPARRDFEEKMRQAEEEQKGRARVSLGDTESEEQNRNERDSGRHEGNSSI